MAIRHRSIVLPVFGVMLLLCSNLSARPTTVDEAEAVVTGWLRAAPRPLGTNLSRRVTGVETYIGDNGDAAYYIVNLQPYGFVVVSADDLIEPIIGFSNDGTYDASSGNPLGALVGGDMNGRVAAVRDTFALQSEVADWPRSKWQELISLAEEPEDGFELMALTCLSDVRVVPLVQSKWGQVEACGDYCYNYYTPRNYPCGCVATVMAQLMRYHEYPTVGIGRHSFRVSVGNTRQTVYTRGGDGSGGPYNWDDMMLDPDSNCSSLNETHRQAIGAICYDAGIAVDIYYEFEGSGALPTDMMDALIETFQFSNAVWAYNNGNNIGSGLNDMINPNLDAKLPVILGVSGNSAFDAGHAIICDGYGYDSSTLYHHLNMGWYGLDDVWYNLPDIDTSDTRYTSVFGCLYNIFTSGDGEVISGRVLDPDGKPVADAEVTAEFSGRIFRSVLTDSKGIYALDGLSSNTTYTITPEASGYVFSNRLIRTRSSQDSRATSGNSWGNDFVALRVLNPPTPSLFYVDDDAPVDAGPGDSAVSDSSEDGSASHPFDTIQEGIDAAVTGDIVIILSGTYSGQGNRDLDYKGRDITVRNEDSNDPSLVTIVCDGTVDEPHRGFNFHSYETSLAVLDGVTVMGGYYEMGGGVYFDDCAQPTLTNCIFIGNSASLGGGAFNESSPILVNCIFIDNSADAGGGMYNSADEPDCNPVLTACIFQSNTVTHNGGAMYNWGQTGPILNGCEFIRNSVSEGGGGAIRNNESGSPTLTNCVFIENSAQFFGGAIRSSNGGVTTITNCTFGDNSADDGKAIACTGDDGGDESPCIVRITNSILWDGSDEIYSDDDSQITVNYSDVRSGPNAGVWSGQGNINSNPQFADTGNDDYHLKSREGRWNPTNQSWVRDQVTSSCIDAGDLGSPVGHEPSPNGDIINMGAYGGTLQASKSYSVSQKAPQK
jgi:predicted outer membrane repeat protein